MPDIPLAPPLPLSVRVLRSNYTIPADTSAYVTGPFEVALNVVLEIAAGAVLEVG